MIYLVYTLLYKVRTGGGGRPYLASAELADGGPSLGGELSGVKSVVVRHVRPERCPGGLVVGVHAQAGPDVLGHLGGLLSCECLGDSECDNDQLVG